MKHSHPSFNRLAPALRSSAAHRLIRAIPFCLLIAASASYLFWSASVSAVTRTWDGGGADNSWNTAANWSDDTAPGIGDVAVFDGTSTKPATINVNINVAGIQIGAGYTAIITQAGGVNITIGTSGFNQSAGTFNAGSGSININGGFDLSRATFNQTAGALNIAGSFSDRGGVFQGGSGDIDINGSFSLSGRSLPVSIGSFTSTSGVLSIAGDFSHSNSFSAPAIFNHNSGTVIFDGADATIDVPVFFPNTTGTETFNHMILNSNDGATRTIGDGDTLNANGAVQLVNGKLDGGTLNSSFSTEVGPEFDGGAGTLKVTGSTGGLVSGGARLPSVILNISSGFFILSNTGTVDFDGPLQIVSGTLSQGVEANVNAGYLQSGGVFQASSANINVIGDFKITGGTFQDGAALLNVTGFYQQTGGTFDHLASTINITGDFNQSGGTFNAGSGSISAGSFTLSFPAIFNHSTGALNISNGFDQLGGGTFAGGSGDIDINGSFSLAGGSTLFSSGTFTSTSGTLSVAGDFSHQPSMATSTFNNNSGTVIFDGADAAIDVLTTETFRHLTFEANDGATKTIANGDTLTAGGLLQLLDGNLDAGTLISSFAGQVGSAFDGGTGTLRIAAGIGAQMESGARLPNVILASGLLATGNTGTITFEGALTVQGGSFSQGNCALLFQSDYMQSGGTFSGGTGNIDLDGVFILNSGSFTSTSGTFSIGQDLSIFSGAFAHNNGTLVFDGGGADIHLATVLNLNDLRFEANDGAVKNISNEGLNAAGNLTLANGLVNGNALVVKGNLTVAAGADGGTTGISFSGTASQTFTNQGGVNSTGSWNVIKDAGAVTLASDMTISTSLLRINGGTLDQGASFNVAANAVQIGPEGFLKNLGTGDLTLEVNLRNDGSVELNSGGVGCGQSDSISIRSSISGVQCPWQGAGTFTLIDVDISDQAGSAPIIAYSSTNSGNNGANWDIRSNCTGAPTDADLELFEATGVDGQILIHWRTGFEVDNLGFNLFRDDNGSKTRLNPAIIAGSALVAGAGTPLTAGRPYYWKDDGKHTASTAQYWLEALDLNGKSAWHGPIHTMPPANSKSSAFHQQAALLDRLNTGEAQQNSTTLVEPKAAALQPAQMLAALQTDLAGHPAIKLSITHEGWYTVSQPDLLAAGLAPRTDPRFLQLFVDGKELPIQVTGATDGSFDPADAIEFYGIGIDSPYSNRHTYRLIAGQEPGKRIALADTGKGDSSPSNFLCTVERRDRVLYFSALLNGDKENFFGPVISATEVDQSLDLRHVDPAADGRLELEVALQGVTAVSHRVKVTLNGNDLGALDFSGQAPVKMSFPISQSDLREGNNALTLVSQSGASDISLVDYIRLAYWHTDAADNDSLRLTATGNQQIKLDGFSNPDIRVLDVTDQADVQEVTVRVEPQGKNNYTATFTAPGDGQRTLLALTARQMQQPAAITADQPSSWRLAGRGADLLIIAPRSFFGALESLQAQRQAQGLSVALVDIEDVYDEFSNGQKTPQAVKDFLAFAKRNWKKAPRYVLLAGDASYDTKNYLGHGDGDLVPTKLIDTIYMEAASDDWLADFNNDGLTEMAIGRLPAGTADEAAQMVKKLTAYAYAAPAEELLLVADENDGYSFEGDIAQLQLLAPGNLRVNVIQRGSMDIAMARQQLQEGINRGQMIVNYAGHGSLDLWRGHLLMNADASELTNARQLPLFVMMTCLNGYYIDPGLDSLAEALLKADQGGAIAVWASSGMTLPIDQAVLNQQFYRLLFSQAKTKGGKALTMGEAAMQAKAAITDIDVRTTWIFFGDPTMRLK